jgi:hypothetical protein
MKVPKIDEKYTGSIQRNLFIMWRSIFRLLQAKGHCMYKISFSEKQERVRVKYVSKIMPPQEVTRFACTVAPALARKCLNQYDKIKVRGHSRS